MQSLEISISLTRAAGAHSDTGLELGRGLGTGVGFWGWLWGRECKPQGSYLCSHLIHMSFASHSPRWLENHPE